MRCLIVACLGLALTACEDAPVKAKPDASEAASDLVFAADTPDQATSAETGAETAPETLEDSATSGPTDAGVQEVTLPKPKDGCAASCQDKVCGPDGCGSVCGFCQTGQICAQDGSKCNDFCKPKCDTKKCGDNGCGGSCGACEDKFHCGVDFLCHADSCVGSCAGKVCGEDGCGKSCGLCASGDLCQAGGQCKPGPCKGIPKGGACSGDFLTHCQDPGPNEAKVIVDCGAKPGKTCGYDPVQGSQACIDKPPCVISCKSANGTKKECGDDGCGGVCGTCAEGWACPGGACVPGDGDKVACGNFAPQGKCYGNVWAFCNAGGYLSKVDCGEGGLACKWDGAKGKYSCQ